MNKRRITAIVIVSVVVVLALTLFVCNTIFWVKGEATRNCFDDLEVAAKQLSTELDMVIGGDHTTLSAIGTIISNQDNPSNKEICDILNSYDYKHTYISSLEVLRPDNTMLLSDGNVIDASKYITFDEEVKTKHHLSGLEYSLEDPSIKVVRHAVPIEKNGKTVAILYGVISADDLAKRYTTGLYNSKAYVYIEDGDTGEFILDTWHKTQGNINELGKRETLSGYSLKESIYNMSKGIDGELAFVSKTTGEVLYMYYEPLSINNWNIMISVEEKYALAKSEEITKHLYLMALLCGIVLLLYFIFIMLNFVEVYRQTKRNAIEDNNTGLLNRNAYEKFRKEKQNQFFPIITCVFVDANGLHELNNRCGHAEGDKLLQAVADALIAEFDDEMTFRVGGDEFIAFSEEDSQDACMEKMNRIMKVIEDQNYSIASGVASHENEIGLERITEEADALMLNNKRKYYQEHDRRRDR